MTQNTSSAVMAQRKEPHDSLDHFPTPPWAARALIAHVLPAIPGWYHPYMTAWEPACAEGHMARALAPQFRKVWASDVHDYGFGDVADFLWQHAREPAPEIDWVITNPPFRLAEQFIWRGLKFARSGVAMLVRTGFLDTTGRWRRLFHGRPPAVVAQFSERVPMVKGRLDPKASTATAYAWLAWHADRHPHRGRDPARIVWIPPCRKELERPGDYLDLEARGALL